MTTRKSRRPSSSSSSSFTLLLLLLLEIWPFRRSAACRTSPTCILPYLYLCSYRCFRKPQPVEGPIPQEVKSLLQACKELEGLDDRPEEDLYSHFEACYQWIEQVRQSGGKLIVNW